MHKVYAVTAATKMSMTKIKAATMTVAIEPTHDPDSTRPDPTRFNTVTSFNGPYVGG